MRPARVAWVKINRKPAKASGHKAREIQQWLPIKGGNRNDSQPGAGPLDLQDFKGKKPPNREGNEKIIEKPTKPHVT